MAETLKIVGEFVDNITPGLEKVAGGTNSLKSSLDNLAGGLASGGAATVFAGLAVAATAAVAAIASLTNEAINNAAAMGEMAQKMGLTTDQLQEFNLAAELGGASTRDMQMALRGLNDQIDKAASDESSKAAKMFKELGINVKDASGNLISGSDALKQIADKFANAEDGARKSALAMELGGRGMVNLIPMLNEGADSIERINKAQKEMGAVWTAEEIKMADEYTDSMDMVWKAIKSIGDIIAKELLPYMVEWAKYLAESAKEGGTLNLVIRGLAEAFVFLMGFLDPLIVGFSTLMTTIKVVGMGIGAVAASIVAVTKGEFGQAKDILVQYTQDAKKAYLDLADVVNKTRDPKTPTPSGEKKTGILPSPGEIEKATKDAQEYSKWLDKMKVQIAELSAKQVKELEVAMLKTKNLYEMDRNERAGWMAAETLRLEVMEKANKLRAEAEKFKGKERADAMAKIDEYQKRGEKGGDLYENAYNAGRQIEEATAKAKVWQDTVIKNRDALKDLTIQQEQYNIMLEKGAITQEEYTKLMRDNARAQEDLAASQTIAGQAFNEYITKNRRSMEDTVQKMAAIRDANAQGKMSAAEYTKAMYDLQKSYDDLNPTYAINQVEKMNEEIKKTTASFEGMFADYIFDAMQGKWGNLADTVKKAIDRMVANMLAAKIQMALFGDMGSTPAGKTPSSTGLLGGLFGSIFGMRESGGPVKAGMPYIVGEKRPEVFIPPTDGYVAPDASALGGQTYITIQAVDTQSFNQALAKDPRFLTQLVMGAQRKYGITGT